MNKYILQVVHFILNLCMQQHVSSKCNFSKTFFFVLTATVFPMQSLHATLKYESLISLCFVCCCIFFFVRLFASSAVSRCHRQVLRCRTIQNVQSLLPHAVSVPFHAFLISQSPRERARSRTLIGPLVPNQVPQPQLGICII